jgi:hypothetical protein
LQQTSILNPANWQPATNPVNVISNENRVTVPIGPTTTFFRLRYP